VIVARTEILDALARQAEFDVAPVTSRAGAAVVRDAEHYLAFFAVLGEPTPLGKAEIAAQLRGRI